MNRSLFTSCFFLLPTLVWAHPRQDTVQMPLCSRKGGAARLRDLHQRTVRLPPLPPLAAPSEPVLSSADKTHIRDLIRQLANVADPDYGLSPTLSGHDFAPITGAAHAGAMLLTAHNFKHSPAALELVQLGPRALPFLLQHLDDATPTRLTMKHDAHGFGGMGYGHEMDCNEANPRERKIWKKTGGGFPDLLKHPLRHYTVKVGDICFNIIGQIVGRSYLAVRYQPTAIVVINSPVADARLAREVRMVWGSPTPTSHLFHSLLTDYSTRGRYNDFASEGWTNASQRQCEAAMRLLYYFPRQTTSYIAARLHHFRVQRTGPAAGLGSTDKELAVWEKRELANGVQTSEFVQAVSWCPAPSIQTEMAVLVKRTGDTDVMAAAVQGLAPAQRKALRLRVQTFLKTLPAPKGNWNYEGRIVLEAVAHYWEADANPVVHAFMQTNDPVHLSIVCDALEEASTPWSLTVLRFLLSDRRTIPDTLHRTTPSGERQILMRVCDAAAQALVLRRPDLKFDLEQPYSQLDKEIATIHSQL